MKSIVLLPSSFKFTGQKIIKGGDGNINERKYLAIFGTSPEVCSKLWNMIRPEKNGVLPKHLLWELIFLKISTTESVMSSIFKDDEKTYRLWVWYFISCISKLKKMW